MIGYKKLFCYSRYYLRNIMDINITAYTVPVDEHLQCSNVLQFRVNVPISLMRLIIARTFF